MISFATGVLCALVLAGCTYWAMQAGTITMVERSESLSTMLDGVWGPMSPAGMSAPAVTGKIEE